MSLVLKNFINNLFIMKSRDLSCDCDCLIGSTSRPYNKIGIHFAAGGGIMLSLRPSRCPSRCLSTAVPTSARHAGASTLASHAVRRPATMAVDQHVVRAGESLLCQYGLARRFHSRVKNGIVCMAGKSIMQMVLRGHQMTAGDLRLFLGTLLRPASVN